MTFRAGPAVPRCSTGMGSSRLDQPNFLQSTAEIQSRRKHLAYGTESSLPHRTAARTPCHARRVHHLRGCHPRSASTICGSPSGSSQRGVSPGPSAMNCLAVTRSTSSFRNGHRCQALVPIAQSFIPLREELEDSRPDLVRHFTHGSVAIHNDRVIHCREDAAIFLALPFRLGEAHLRLAPLQFFGWDIEYEAQVRLRHERRNNLAIATPDCESR